MGFQALINVVFLLPAIFLLVGALRRWWEWGDRLSRLQVEGAGLFLTALLMRYVLYATPLVKIVQNQGVERWLPWYQRGEIGLAGIGLLLFSLGVFLQYDGRRRRLPFTRAERIVVFMSPALGMLLSAIFSFYSIRLPMPGFWSQPVLLVLLGIMPFSYVYCRKPR